MCLLGGWLTFLGPMLGAAIMVALRTFASTFTEYWTLIQGIILMLVIIFLPGGVLGYVNAKFPSPRAPHIAIATPRSTIQRMAR